MIVTLRECGVMTMVFNVISPTIRDSVMIQSLMQKTLPTQKVMSQKALSQKLITQALTTKAIMNGLMNLKTKFWRLNQPTS